MLGYIARIGYCASSLVTTVNEPVTYAEVIWKDDFGYVISVEEVSVKDKLIIINGNSYYELRVYQHSKPLTKVKLNEKL